MTRLQTAAALALFALSGAAGLMYEASWTRQLGLLLGFTERAAAVALAAWFLGVALGSWLGGRWSATMRRPLAGYAVAELVAAGWALVVPPLLGLVGRLPTSAGFAVTAAACMLVLLPATCALGVTLPMLAQHLSPRGRRPGMVSRAYGLNLGGGVAGLLGATFGLLVGVGVQGTAVLAAAISVACGVAALLLARAGATAEAGDEAQVPRQPVSARWYAVAVLSGAGTMALQVLYLRLFARTLHNSSYTFGAVVAAFLAALALGSWRAARSGLPPRRLVARASALVAVLVPTSVLVFAAVTRFGALEPAGGFGVYVAAVLGLVGIIVMPPVTAAGMLLPAAWTAAQNEAGRSGEPVGRLASANTLAAAAGALVTGVVLLGWIGLWGCFTGVVAAYLVVALASRPRGLSLTTGGAGLTAATLALVALMNGVPAALQPDDEQTLATWDTTGGLIQVTQKGTNRRLRRDTHYLMGDSANSDSERNQGHMALLLHPRPRRALFLGLATGITASAVLDHQQVASTDVVELVPEVVLASRMFAAHNGRLHDDGRVRVHVDDARHYLRVYDGPGYDVIVSDLFVPWQSRTGYLYTVEHYQAASRHLAEGGVFVQWICLRQVGRGELGLIARSLQQAFPHVSVWREPAQPRKVGLAGSHTPLALSRAELTRRMAALAHPFGTRAAPRRRAAGLMARYLGSWPPGAAGPLNTDEVPLVEFHAPRTHRQIRRPLAQRLLMFQRKVFSRLPRPVVLTR